MTNNKLREKIQNIILQMLNNSVGKKVMPMGKCLDKIEAFFKQEKEETIRILKQFKGYQCDEPDCSHNLKLAIKSLEKINK